MFHKLATLCVSSEEKILKLYVRYKTFFQQKIKSFYFVIILLLFEHFVVTIIQIAYPAINIIVITISLELNVGSSDYLKIKYNYQNEHCKNFQTILCLDCISIILCFDHLKT